MAISSGAGGSNPYPSPAVTGSGVTSTIGGAIAAPAFPVTSATSATTYSGTFIPSL